MAITEKQREANRKYYYKKRERLLADKKVKYAEYKAEHAEEIAAKQDERKRIREQKKIENADTIKERRAAYAKVVPEES